jgi:hypothetical protein
MFKPEERTLEKKNGKRERRERRRRFFSGLSSFKMKNISWQL